MNDAQRVALAVAFYLSKFDRKALDALSYKNFSEAFQDAAAKLLVKPNTVKDMGDEFDPLHSNSRVGWYQRPLSERPSRVRVVELLDGLSFEALTSFVRDLLHNAEYRGSQEVAEVIASLKVSETQHASSTWAPRGATGRRAEELFMQIFAQGQIPICGQLTDRRDDGCGCDFLIQATDGEHPFEIKGLAGQDGGILLTDKEWQTARSHRNTKSSWPVISTTLQNGRLSMHRVKCLSRSARCEPWCKYPGRSQPASSR